MEAFWQKIAEILFLSKLEQRWRKVAKVLAVFVVFWTTYMLILPAITLEKDTYCGLDEHLHEDSCYIIENTLICGYESVSAAENEELTSNTAEDSTTEETTIKETTEEATEETTDESISGTAETFEKIHTHSPECYEEKKTIICTVKEHSHEESCFIEELASGSKMHDINLLGDENDVAPLADAVLFPAKIDFDDLDSTGKTYYIVYTYYNNNSYALDGNGNAVAITVDSNGFVTSSSMGSSLYWNFSRQSGTTYIIQNLGTSRYMHSYNNDTGIGVTTEGKWSSVLESSGNGEDEYFAVRSNSIYSCITTSSGRVVFRTADSFSSAAKFYIAKVDKPHDTYHVWFDGTCGGLMSLYDSPDSYLGVSLYNPTITLPETWTSPSKYSYTLNGWYDIKNHIYYEPGATVTITDNTVFYADWVATSYDVGIADDTNIKLVAPSLDTNSFIRTDMFDYGALFNMLAVTHTGSVTATGHNETWSVVRDNKVPYNNADSLGFIFRDWDARDSDISYPSNLVRLNDNQSTQITSGIIDYVNDMSGKNIIDLLFKPETDVIGKTYVGQANYLYQFMEKSSKNYDGEHNGYYYYDSQYNAASYNQTNERFYIYNYLERTSDSRKDSCDANGIKLTDGGYSDFLPFNSPYANNHNNKTIVMYPDGDKIADNYQYDAKATNQQSDIANAGTNYWFGMKSEIQFYLPDKTGTVDQYKNYGNISSHGQHMTFEFSGDDDLWVFIDGKLVMDIGGLHGIMTGKIDFSTGIITTSLANNALGTGTAAEVNTKILPAIEAGDHTLTVYYMERGGSQSNCAIYFNITPRYGIELFKQDAVSGEGLTGAKFGVYTDISCDEDYRAELWTSEQAYKDKKGSEYIFTAKNGKVSFWGISAGKVYYIKELESPPGYPVTDDIIRISMNNLGNSICTADVLRGADGKHTDGFEIVQSTANESYQQITMKIANQEYAKDKRSIAVYKKWDITDKSLIPESVTVYLMANGLSTGKSAVLSEVNNWSYVWIDLPVYDSAGPIDYTIYEEQAKDFYTDVEVSDKVQLINAWVQTDSFYDGGTFLIVDRSSATETDKGNALSVNSAGHFEWIDFETAKNNPSAHWFVNADGMGFHIVDEEGYHIILDETDRFLPYENGNRILYYDRFGLAARNNNTYYYLNKDFAAATDSRLELELYINMDILVHEEDSEENNEDFGEEEVEGDGQIAVTVYTVTNTHINEEKRTSLKVNKHWEDGESNHINHSITVRLYADGVDTGRRLTLNHANNWTDSFDGLLYEKDGKQIEYTVEEETIKGYYPEYSEIVRKDGGTKEIITYTPAWVPETSLTDGEIYVFYNGSYALSRNDTSIVASPYNANNITDDQKWLVTIDSNKVYISNPDSPSSYLYVTGNSNSATLSMSTSNKTAITYSTTNRRLSFSYTYNNRSYTRYFRISNGSLSTTTGTNNLTSFSLMKWGTISTKTEIILPPTYEITVTNYIGYYILPETGGSGTQNLYIIGGLLITLSAVFLICIYIIDRGRRRRDSG